VKEKDLAFDRSKHVCYSKMVKKGVKKYLKEHYPEENTDALFEKIQLKYVEYLQDQPDLGGKKSGHNRKGGTYDCFLIFACYEVLERKMPVDDVYNLVNSMFLPPFEKLGKIFNLNHKWTLKLMDSIIQSVAREDAETLKSGAEGYITIAEPFDPEQGIRYRFERCPIAEFAKKHGFEEIMPAMCNGDFPAMELVHGKLIRKHTCANSDVCDYQMVGDRSPLLKEHPQKTDAQGYFYSE